MKEFAAVEWHRARTTLASAQKLAETDANPATETLGGWANGDTVVEGKGRRTTARTTEAKPHLLEDTHS